MEYNFSLISNEEKISLINDKINSLLKRRSAIISDIEMVLNNPTMDIITISKIQAEIDDIDLSILALQSKISSIEI